MAESSSSRPRRAAAIDARLKVEESFEKWGQPPTKPESKRVTPRYRRSATTSPHAENDTYSTPNKAAAKKRWGGRKHSRQDSEHHGGFGPSSSPPERNAGDESEQPFAKRHRKKSPEHGSWAEGSQTPSKTKVVVLTAQGSQVFRQGLQQYANLKDQPEAPRLFFHSPKILSGASDEAAAALLTDVALADDDGARQESLPSKTVKLKLPACRSPDTTTDKGSEVEGLAGIRSVVGNEGCTLTGYHFIKESGAELLAQAEGAKGHYSQHESSGSIVVEPEHSRTKSNAASEVILQQRAPSLADTAVQEYEDLAATSMSADLSFFPKNRRRFLQQQPSKTKDVGASSITKASDNKDVLSLLSAYKITKSVNGQTLEPASARMFHSAERSPMSPKDQSLQNRATPSFNGITPGSNSRFIIAIRTAAKNAWAPEVDSSSKGARDVQPQECLPTTPISVLRSIPNYSHDYQHFRSTPGSLADSGDHVAIVDNSQNFTSRNHNNGFVIPRKPHPFHPPEMLSQGPNVFFDQTPWGASMGTSNYDPIVGRSDHSDPRTFHTPHAEDMVHLVDALEPTVAHFKRLTGGVMPHGIPFDSGYDIAYMFLQAQLRCWLVQHRPDFAHKNAIPVLFKLERWEGGIQHWRCAKNSPVSPAVPSHEFSKCSYI